MIDPEKNQVPIWIVWRLCTNGNTVLCAICLTNQRARKYRKVLEQDHMTVRARIEPREANHMCAEMFTWKDLAPKEQFHAMLRAKAEPRRRTPKAGKGGVG